MNIVITGANGFIGSNIASHLASKGHNIQALVHYLFKAPPANIKYRAFMLESFSSDIIPNNTDMIIHTAISHSDNIDIDIKATKRLYDIAQRKDVKHFIYISRRWANENSLSLRSIKNHKISQSLIDKNALIVEAEHIIGKGGFQKTVMNIVNYNSIIPIIDARKKNFNFVRMEDFLAEIEIIIADDRNNGVHTIEYFWSSKLDYYELIAKVLNKKPRYIHLSFKALKTIIKTLSILKISLNISDNYLNELEENSQIPCS